MGTIIVAIDNFLEDSTISPIRNVGRRGSSPDVVDIDKFREKIASVDTNDLGLSAFGSIDPLLNQSRSPSPNNLVKPNY